MGAEADVNLRWITPLPLWSGVLAGPLAWAVDLTASYALVKWTCSTQREAVLDAISVAALLIVAGGALVSFAAWRQTADEPTDGGEPRQRAHFMATLGMASNALFALTIIAKTIPTWVLDACQ